VIDGLLTLRKIENVATGQNNRPKLVVKITGAWISLLCTHLLRSFRHFRVWGDVGCDIIEAMLFSLHSNQNVFGGQHYNFLPILC
jgi:hypothetical protein